MLDAIIIGAGQAGPPLAERLAAAGMSVAVIERKLFGGTCVNTGCTPTKTLIASARVARMARRAAEYGVMLDGPVRIDMARVKARKDEVSGRSRRNVERWLRGMPNCRVLQGHARLESPNSVRVGDELLTAERIFLNVGARATIPDMPGVRDVDVLTSGTILDLDHVPRHLVVVGGSYIGLEFAQMYRRFGAEVTVVEKGERLIGREDPDVSDAIRELLEKEGVTVRLSADCIRFAPHADGVEVGVNCASGSPSVVGSHVLLAVGRTPNTDDLSLDRAGVVRDSRGFITVDDKLRTNVPGIWAMGDCNGRGAFTHTAYNDFEIVAANLLDGDPRSVDDRIQAYALYTDPPLARVGMTDEAVRRSGRRALVGQRPMTRVGRAVEKGEAQGFMRIVVDADSREILGAAILGPGGDEAIHGVLDMMYAKAPYPTLQRAVHIHPTVAELLPTLLGELKPLE
ncbi:pyruvate/2-oxoglutarate dehydrogenase complex dihydrolipoamide dehydrogenase (E3) component [Azospirillum lipoferum]|uniref:FAD-containing oxidoreductase n=1 Tax=Azospirillum lipoferum TaxID=193 RepID=A0A5A9GLY6_AZOLI|nr:MULTISPECIES: FAD-containing oxidoreductase [Azospirillum]KAA0595347.1 FAD-containing oxidoreductase [Azospirillum lipoferum]MCP1611761.1 pyruvate/2-oxoglutarate dehydrogenase complex dihydrolipoamide dehydrogenase (E3) component [Azospirillum lipoferum]MDW5533481.1 FAD-containing oxidoreductase [Azospirillum sp. NL1]